MPEFGISTFSVSTQSSAHCQSTATPVPRIAKQFAGSAAAHGGHDHIIEILLRKVEKVELIGCVQVVLREVGEKKKRYNQES